MPHPAWPASHFALKWPAVKGIRVRGPEQLHTPSSPGARGVPYRSDVSLDPGDAVG